MSASALTMPAAETAPPAAATRSSALARLCATELKLLLRERVRLGLTIVFPIVLLIILGSFHSLRKPEAVYGGYSFIDVYTVTLVVFALALQALTNLPMILADYRERGVLRRLQTTPIGPARVLAAQLVANLVVAAATVVVLFALARIAFGVPLPRQIGGFIVAVLLTAAELVGIGLLVAAVAPTGRVARGIGALLFYPMMFFAGLWIPLPNMSATLQHVSHATPLGAAIPALDNAAAGSWPTALQLGTMAAYAVVFGLGAAKFFRWE
jgi:ABC-2 type transport system permease protein